MARKRRHPAQQKPPRTAGKQRTDAALRIIGGSFGGRRLAYAGDFTTRPMKERVREAVFNLIGPAVRGKHAIDLFAGTGALGLEAISRGAARATFLERHFPTAATIRENIATLQVEPVTTVHAADTFLWVRSGPDLGDAPWLVFCSPPYDFYSQRTDQMLQLIETLVEKAPASSVFVVEADDRFDFELLPHAARWDVRSYRPAVVGILTTS